MSYLRRNKIRIILSSAGFLGVVFAPPWVPLLAMGLLAVRYPAPEVLVIGFLVDLVWLPGFSLQSLPLFSLAGLALLWGLEPLRNEFLISKRDLI